MYAKYKKFMSEGKNSKKFSKLEQKFKQGVNHEFNKPYYQDLSTKYKGLLGKYEGLLKKAIANASSSNGKSKQHYQKLVNKYQRLFKSNEKKIEKALTNETQVENWISNMVHRYSSQTKKYHQKQSLYQRMRNQHSRRPQGHHQYRRSPHDPSPWLSGQMEKTNSREANKYLDQDEDGEQLPEGEEDENSREGDRRGRGSAMDSLDKIVKNQQQLNQERSKEKYLSNEVEELDGENDTLYTEVIVLITFLIVLLVGIAFYLYRQNKKNQP
jgi:hypothetical protein